MRQGNENFNKNKKMNSEVKFADLLADESINENTNHKSANNNMKNKNIITHEDIQRVRDSLITEWKKGERTADIAPDFYPLFKAKLNGADERIISALAQEQTRKLGDENDDKILLFEEFWSQEFTNWIIDIQCEDDDSLSFDTDAETLKKELNNGNEVIVPTCNMTELLGTKVEFYFALFPIGNGNEPIVRMEMITSNCDELRVLNEANSKVA